MDNKKISSHSRGHEPKVSSRVSQERVEKAVDALLKWIKSKAKHEKSQLLEHDELIYMVVTLNRIPDKARTNPYKIPIPHPLFPLDGTQEICLIINDKEEKGINSKVAKERVKRENLPISKVLKFSKLKTDYRPFEAKRQLCGSYDLFMADKSVIPLLPKLLGKAFFKKKKHPIPVDLTHKQWKGQFESVCSSAFFYIGSGTCTVVKVARISQAKEEIVENVITVIEGLTSVVPRKWKNIRSLHLKSLESLALPLYQSIPEMPLKIEGLKMELQASDKKPEKKRVYDRDAEQDSEKKLFKKGRIHEVRYMDHTLGDLSDGNISGDDQNELNLPGSLGNRAKDIEVSEKEEKVAGGLSGPQPEDVLNMRSISKERSGQIEDAVKIDLFSDGKVGSLYGQNVHDVPAASGRKKRNKFENLEAGAMAKDINGKDEVAGGLSGPQAKEVLNMHSNGKERSAQITDGKKKKGLFSEGKVGPLCAQNVNSAVTDDVSPVVSGRKKRNRAKNQEDGTVANRDEGKLGSLHGQNVNVAITNDVSPVASGYKRRNKSEDLEDGKVANKDEARVKKGKTKKLKKIASIA